MRYLLPALFLAALPISWALETPLSRGLFLAAVVLSSAIHLLASFSWPHFPASVVWPVANVSAWLVAHRAVAPNLGLSLGLPPLVSLLPALVVVVAAFVLCARELPPAKPSPWAACVLGLAIFGATLVRPPAVSASDADWRQGVARRLREDGPESKRLAPI